MSGIFKANVDEAVFKDHSSVGIGVVLQDDKGSVIGALSQRIYAPLGPLEVEANAMEAAMLFVRDMGIHDIVFEGDSLQVRNFLKCNSLVPLLWPMSLRASFSIFSFFIVSVSLTLKRQATSLHIC